MENYRAKMFNKKASDPKNKPDQILKAMELKSGQCIADIGSGGGYFSFRFAKIVGKEGKVYAIDTDPGLLESIKKSSKDAKLDNIVPTLVSKGVLDLPKNGLDLIFMRNVTHHIPERVNYFRSLIDFLKPDGKVVIIEYKKGESFSFRGLFGHDVPKETIIREMEKAGYKLDKEFDFLPEQHFTIYSKNRR